MDQTTSHESSLTRRRPFAAITPHEIPGHVGLRLLLAAVLAGTVCRVAQYAADRSFWHDEASLVLNIRTHTARQLLGPLDYSQAAPPLFLLAERGLFRIFGGSEMSLRLLPLTCGLGSVIIFALLARRVLPSPWDALGTALFAMGDRLVFQSAEVKQYGVDVLTAVLLTLIAVGWRPGLSVRTRFITLAIAGPVAVCFSYPAALVFAALCLALMPEVTRGRRSGWALFLLGLLPAAAVFLILLKTIIPAQQDAVLTDYWQNEFINLLHPWTIPWWLIRHLHSLCNYPLPAAGPVVLGALLAGAWSLIQARRIQLLTMLCGPIVVAIAAAIAQRYPFDGARLTNFLSASVLLTATEGLRWGRLKLERRVGWLSLLPAGYVLGLAVYWAALHLVFPRNRGHLRPIAQYVRENMQPNDGIYAIEQREFQCYWPDGDKRVRWKKLDPANRIPFDRFWIVWSFSSRQGRQYRYPLVTWARQFCTQKDQIANNGGEAVLLERDGRPVPAGQNSPPLIP